MSSDPLQTPRGKNGQAPDVFRPGGWVPMRQYRNDEAVDFVIVGTGAGGGTLACKLAEAGFYHVNRSGRSPKTLETRHFLPLRCGPAGLLANSVVGLDAGPWFRPLEDFASDEAEQTKLYWTDDRNSTGDNPVQLGSFAIVSLRFRLEWFCSRSLLGYGADWPLDWRELWNYYTEVEQALKISGPVTYPWGPKRPRYPYRAHELNAAAQALAEGCIEVNDADRATGVHYYREGALRFQRARNVAVAGYAVETPRLLLNSATHRFRNGLANSSGLVGRYFTVQANQAVWGISEREIRSYKGPPSLALTEHWNYDDSKDFFGGYCYMAQGPLPQLWANTRATSHGLLGETLEAETERYNHQVGLKIVGEMMPQERNRVTLADDKDQYGLPIGRVEYSWCDNDKRLIEHSLGFMTQALQAIDATDIWRQTDDTCHMNGSARMGDDPRTSVVDADCRSWDIPNLWVCDGSVFPTVGGVNPSLTIQAIACRTADRIKQVAARGEL